MYIFHLGNEKYGLWLVVLTLISYLGFSHLGIGQSVSNYVASRNSVKDDKEIQAAVATAFWLYAAIITPLILIVFFSVNTGSFGNLIKYSKELEGILEPVILISSILFLFKLPLTVFGATLRSLNLIYIEQLFSLLFVIVQFVGVLIVLNLDLGMLSLSYVYGGTGILLGITTFLFLKTQISGLNLSVRNYRHELAKNLLKPGGYFFLLQIAGALIAGMDNIVIGVFLGASEVVPYAVAMKLCLLLMSLISVITANLLPSITSTYALGDKEGLLKIYLTLLQVCLGLGLLLFVTLVNIGPEFIKVWAGLDSYVGDFCFYLIMIHMLINTLLWPADSILVGTTRHRVYSMFTVVEGLLNLGLSIFWVQIWGVVGVICATIFARLFVTFWFMIHQSFSITGLSIKKFLDEVIKPFIFPVIGAVISIFFLSYLGLSGWYKVIFHSISISLVFGFIVFYVSLDTVTRKEIYAKARMLMKE
jgi:O-antigen/teichoic acid export membrane protein